MIRNIIGIICYVIAVFFLFTTHLMCFVNFEADIFADSDPSAWMKLLIVGAPFFLALIVIGIGLVIRRSHNRKREVGVILISASCVGAFNILITASLYLSPEVKVFFPEEDFNRMNDFFSDYISGCLSILVFAFVGALLYRSSAKVEAVECETMLEKNKTASRILENRG